METGTEGVATIGVTSAEESRGEGLREDHGRAQALPAPCVQPRARTFLGAEPVHHLPELMEVGLQLKLWKVSWNIVMKVVRERCDERGNGAL